LITVITLRDIFDCKQRQVSRAPAGRSLIDYVPEDWKDNPRLRVVWRNEAHDRERARQPIALPGDYIVSYLLPQGPAAIILVPILVSLVLTGVSYGIQALTAPSRRGIEQELETSPTYGFNPEVNTVRPGTRIPIIYGTHRYGGHIIGQFIRPQRDTPERSADPRAGELHTLLGLCSGPIAGVEDVQIDGNPWTDYQIPPPEVRLGHVHQAPITGFEDLVIQSPKDSVVTNAGGPVQFTTQGEVDAFELIFRFPGGLYIVSSRGQFGQRTIDLLIEHRENGTSEWIRTAVKTITAQTSNAFDAWFDSGRLERAQYQIRITRRTPDDTSATGFSELRVLSLNDILEETLSYPKIALLAVRQLPTNRVQGRAPKYTSLVHGKIVKIYSNPTTYTEEWSDNPSWCLRDFLTDPFDGLGAWIKESDLDIDSFLDWGAFCDEMVAKDVGGDLEKQFRLDIVLDGSLRAIEVIKQMTTAGRAFFLQRGSKWAVRPDRKEGAVQLFTMGRIAQGEFNVIKQSRSEQGNYLIGQIWNRELDYQPDPIPREDPLMDVTDEQIEQTVNLLGVTRTSQARRLLNYYLLSNRFSRRVIQLEVGAEALGMEAGDVFLVAHDVPGWGFSGKIRSLDSTGSEVILDREVTIEAGKTYVLTVIHDDDSIESVPVTNLPETTFRLSCSGGWATVPRIGADYTFGESQKNFETYRCLSISRGGAPWRRKINAKQYSDSIYGEDLTALPPRSVSRLPDPGRIPPDVRDLRVSERQLYAEDGTLTEVLDVYFTLPIELGVRAQVYWREAGLPGWEPASSPTDIGYVTITGDIRTPGVTYEISVVSVSAGGARKVPELGVKASVTTTGVIRQPDKPFGFTASRTASGLVFQWLPLDPVKNFDLAYYEIRQGTQWETALSVGKTTGTQLETTIIAQGEQTFLLKAWNTAGRDSAQAATVVFTVEGRIGENVILTREEEPSWTGVRQNWTLSGSELVLETEADIVAWRGRIDPSPLRSYLRPGGFGTSFRSTAIYTTAAFQITTTNAVRIFISTLLEALQVDVTLYWTAPEVGDKTWESDFAKTRAWAVAPEGRVILRVEMRFSINTSAESDFGPWAERPQNIEVTAKWAQARVFAEVRDPSFTVKLQKFHLLFDVPDIVDSGVITTTSTGTIAVTYNKAYNNAPKVTALVLGATAGDDIVLLNKTQTGFDIEVRNAGSRVVRTVNWNAIGF